MSAPSNEMESGAEPCWMTHPSPGGRIGAVGVSRTLSAGDPPLVIARRRAARGLLGYLGGDDLPEGLDKRLREMAERGGTAELAGRVVRFAAPFERKGYLYAHAVLGGKPLDRSWRSPCPDRTAVAPGDCRPAWICTPVQGDHVGVLGVSFRAATRPRQFELAANNAVKLLEYTLGVQVEGAERFLRAPTAAGTIRLRTSEFDIEKSGGVTKDIRLYTKQLRIQGDVLYVWLVSPDLPPYPAPEDLDWMREPSPEGMNGAVGMSIRTADGLLSTQIERAFEKGIFALAKNRGAHIESIQHLRHGGGGRYYLEGVTSEVDTSLRARLLGFHPRPDGRVFVWVVEAGPASRAQR
ncbi:hypothetical protein [Thiohalorhabdus methylotrophus]|uniref:GAF domain-containing protein n=1 Tax=Thiohalorhabdus methylotrophus TaxID=3242694 RepID=A0ABV4TW77_9GAMM